MQEGGVIRLLRDELDAVLLVSRHVSILVESLLDVLLRKSIRSLPPRPCLIGWNQSSVD